MALGGEDDGGGLREVVSISRTADATRALRRSP
jgi:hypothetical protein